MWRTSKHMVLPARCRVAHRCRQRAITEVDAQAPNDGSRLVDDETKTPALVEEGQPIAPRILIHAALAQAGDLSLPHHGLNRRGLKLQALSDDRCLDIDIAITNLDLGHGHGPPPMAVKTPTMPNAEADRDPGHRSIPCGNGRARPSCTPGCLPPARPAFALHRWRTASPRPDCGRDHTHR